MSRPAMNDSTGSPWRAVLVSALFFAVVLVAMLTQLTPEVLRGELLDPDGYMRLLRVERLVETGGWYDGTSPRSNAPFGEELHWTRPLDVLLLALAAPAAPLVGWRDALFAAGVAVSPLLLFGTALVIGWGAAPFTGGRSRPLTVLAVLAQPGLIAFGLPGRPDHHLLILLLFAGVLGLHVRLFHTGDEDRARRMAALAGGLAGAGVWVSVEFLLPLAALLVLQGVLWSGGRLARSVPASFSVGLLAVMVAGLVLERPPGALATVEYDRMALPHLLVGALCVGFWHGVARWAGRGAVARLAMGAASAGAGALLAAALFPDFFGGPWTAVDPTLDRLWLRRVEELQPLLWPTDGTSASRSIVYLGQVMVVIPSLLLFIRGGGEVENRSRWMALLLLAVFVPMALWQVRWVTYAAVVTGLVLGEVLHRVRDRVTWEHRPVASTALRVVVTSGLLVGFLFVGVAVEVAFADDPESGAGSGAEACSVRELAGGGGLPLPGEEPVVAAHVDLGPELLYRTRARVLATPYHRNADGVLGAHRLLASVDGEEASSVVRDRGVAGILICHPLDAAFFGTERAGRPTLYGKLVDGAVPPWLEEVPLDGGGGFRLFRVTGSPGPG